ncbi:DUF3626 domain-containing protein [Actinoplanes sp. NBRC 103695]|uniref:DUF3626 domain-containing protein n=1 Tax=Actinoplanes sp. NBRC 103695 TaxID=3032202 RepID=UPI0024A10F0F|nr:DUF3626 domain-containing protein [Actinoplanes sp. NBRC 103695]GLY95101.1 hypothetical protein Acsp02_23560 [Actinoplanes sp. NBRC 103695]
MDRALAHVRALGTPGEVPPASITVSFHPDRLLADGLTVAEHLVAEGVYRSQFETRISNGGLTAFPGGDRDVWERRMFGGAYAGVTVGRPVYGALNLAGHPDGGSPRFGSCHLRLDPVVSARATFSHGDSVTEPAVVGTADTFGGIWAALLAEVAATGRALGLAAASPREWVAALAEPRTVAGRALDDYVEAQVHGGLELAGAVQAVVADPSFAGTPTGALLSRLAPRLEYHPGFVLAPAEFPPDLRTETTPRLAAELASRFGVDRIHAEVVGRAAQAVVRDPASWSAFGPAAEVLQELKYVWHILVLRGRPF